MRIERGAARIEVDPRLVEECVLLAVESLPREERKKFREARDPLYENPEGDERERKFRDLHGGWFTRLKLADGLTAALSERPEALGLTSRCLVLSAVASKDECADLHEDRAGAGSAASPRPVLVILIRARTLLDAEAVAVLLRHELLHVADMLDPGFGYTPDLPALDGGPSHESLVRRRYRTIWDVTIDGRLHALGLLASGGGERRRSELLAAFPLPPGEAGPFFRRFFNGARPTHAEILALAIGGGMSASGAGPDAGPRACALCRFPSAVLDTKGRGMKPATIEAIRADFPAWTPEAGICLQCADLYDARRNLAAAAPR